MADLAYPAEKSSAMISEACTRLAGSCRPLTPATQERRWLELNALYRLPWSLS